MNARLFPLTLTLLAAGAPLTAQPPKGASGDPLPGGAKARLGTDRLRNEFGWPAGVLTPDGKHLVATKGFKSVLLDVTTGREAGELANFPAVFSADGKRAASAAGSVRVWDLSAGKPLQATKRQFSNVALEPVALSGDGKIVAVGAELGSAPDPGALTAIVWDVDAGKPLAEVAPEQNTSVGVRLAPDGRTLATFGRHNDPKRKFGAKDPNGWPEQALELWNTADGERLARVAVSGRMVLAVAFSPDSALVAVSAGDGLIALRDARTGAEKRQLFGRSYLGARLAFAPDGKTLAAASLSGAVQRWSVADGKLLETLEPPVAPQGISAFRLKDLVFTGPDRAVVWGAVGSVAVVWEVPSGKLLSPLGGHFHTVTRIGFTADGKHVLSSGYDSGILRWDAATGALVGPAYPQRYTGGLYFVPVQFLPDANRAVSDRTGSSVYDLTAGTEVFRLPVRENSRGPGYVVRASDDGTKVVTRLRAGNQDKSDRYEVWDLVAPKKFGEVEAPPAEETIAGVTADGKHLFLLTPRGFEDRELIGYSVETGKKLGTVGVPGGITAIAVPGAEPLALVPTKTGKLIVADYATGKTTATLDAGRTGYIGQVAFAPDGKSFALAYQKDTVAKPPQPDEVRVYDWPRGALRHTFTGHSAGVTCLAYSPDGRTLASGSGDTTVLLWDLTRRPK